MITNQQSAVTLENGYVHIVEADEHQGVLNRELLETYTKNYSMPVVLRQMVPAAATIGTREFLERDLDEGVIWRERQGVEPAQFRGKEAETSYNHVSGKEGTAEEFLEEIFTHHNDVYSNLGTISSGFKELEKFSWGKNLFNRVRESVFENDWFQIPGWELSGHLFLGNNAENYEDPVNGAPGSNWHMFPTTNIFVLFAGGKRWHTRPPMLGDHLKDREELIYPSGGRENPVEDRPIDIVDLSPGDVLVNVPYEWHKISNAKGWSFGAAFRVIDRPYTDSLLDVPAIAKNLKLKKMNDTHAHLLTSLQHAANDPRRLAMFLNAAEIMVCSAAKLGL